MICLPLGKECGSIFSSEEGRIKKVPGESEKDLGDRRQSLKLSLCQRTTDSLQSAPLSLKPGSTLVDNLRTLMDNWWTGDGCQPFHIRFLFRQCQCQPELYWQTLYKRQNNYNDNDNGIGRAQTESEENALFYLLKGPFPHSRFGHFQCPKRKSKTTSQ